MWSKNIEKVKIKDKTTVNQYYTPSKGIEN